MNTDACPDGTGGTCESARCGDGFVWAGHEGCDDGNLASGDGCSPVCNLEGCGNGILDPGEECDDGNQNNADACPDDVANGGTCLMARCGDGFVRVGVETCDDGNQNLSDGCPDGPGGNCQNARCGDGFVRTGYEVCDDGNHVDGDGCAADCSGP